VRERGLAPLAVVLGLELSALDLHLQQRRRLLYSLVLQAVLASLQRPAHQ
jgi:hypothetical protein